MIRLTGLWKKQKTNGEVYYGGKLGSGRLLVFRNGKKRAENDPDLVVMLAEDQARDGQQHTASDSDDSI